METKTKIWIGVAITVVVVGSIVGYYFWNKKQSEKKPKSPETEETKAPAMTAEQIAGQ